jgi:hypothetical protein
MKIADRLVCIRAVVTILKSFSVWRNGSRFRAQADIGCKGFRFIVTQSDGDGFTQISYRLLSASLWLIPPPLFPNRRQCCCSGRGWPHRQPWTILRVGEPGCV